MRNYAFSSVLAVVAFGCSLIEPNGHLLTVQTEKAVYGVNEGVAISLYNGSQERVYFHVCGGVDRTLFTLRDDEWIVKYSTVGGMCAGGGQIVALEVGRSITFRIPGGDVGTYLVRVPYGVRSDNTDGGHIESNVFTVQ